MCALVTVRAFDPTPPEWDRRVSGLPGATVFHSSAWLAHLQETQGGSILHAEIIVGDEPVGVFCGVALEKFPFRVVGSPLRGWWTVSMGPLLEVGHDLDDEIVGSLEAYLRRAGVDHVELAQPGLPETVMTRRGFVSEPFPTLWVPLADDEERMFAGVSSGCRNRIRKARKNGLVAVEATGPAVADGYYDQLVEVFARQGLSPTRSRETIRSMVRHLMDAGSIMAIQVKTGDGEVAATGLFPFDSRFAYYLGGASWQRYKHLAPNDLLHWEAMRRAAARGIPRYDMGGGWSQFKEKFGGERTIIHRWRKSYSPLAALARDTYRRLFRVRQVFRGRRARHRLGLESGEAVG